MQQDIQQSIQMALDFIRGIWIKKRYLIISSWLICPLGFVYVAKLPDVFKSEAQVFVDTRSMLAPLLTGISVFQNPDEEVEMVAQTLKSRSNIETIARETDLDITVTTDIEYERLITELTQDIKLNRTGTENIYSISYETIRPELARTVVQETLDMFVEGSIGGNRRDSDTAARFLDEQITEYETRLSEAEQRRADFQRRHSDILPQSGSFNGNLASTKELLSQVQLQIKEAEEQVAALQARLTGRQKTDSFSVRGEDDSQVIRTRFDDRILALEGSLDELKLRFTERHPDVVETQALLDSLKSARDKEIEDFLSEPDNSDSLLLNQMNQEITLEISKLEGQIASLRVRENSFNERIQDLQDKIDLVPQIEAEGIALNRNYNIIKQNYEQLLARKEAADITERASITSDNFQFRIIQPPNIPTEPTGPQRFLGYTLVLILGFGLGIGIAFLISQVNPILVRGQQLITMTGFPILGAVTHLEIAKIKKRNRLNMLVFVASSGTIVFMYAVLVAADILHINIISRVMG